MMGGDICGQIPRCAESTQMNECLMNSHEDKGRAWPGEGADCPSPSCKWRVWINNNGSRQNGLLCDPGAFR